MLIELNKGRKTCLSKSGVEMADLEDLSGGGKGRQDVDTQDKYGGCYYKPKK